MTILNKLLEIKSNAPRETSEKLLQTCSNILEGIKGLGKTVLRGISKIYPNTPEETTDFNPSNLKFVQGNDVAYALSYKDNGDTSKVQLISSPSYILGKSIIHNTGKNIQNERKDQLYLSLLKNSGEIDEIGIFFPTDKGLSLSTYEVKHSVNTSSFKYMGSARLQENIRNDVSSIGSYSDLQATTLDNGDIFVIARREGRDLVSWYIKPGEEGKLEVLAGTNGIIERQLLKLGNSGSKVVLDGNTLLYLRKSTEIIGNEALEKTDIISLDITEAAEKAREGEGIKEFLFGDGTGQIDEKPFFSSKNKIDFLQYVGRGEGDIMAFRERNKSSNKEGVSLVTIIKDGKKGAKLLVYNNFDYDFENSIKQLHVKDNGQGDAVVTAIGEENITTSIIKSSNKIPSKPTIIPISNITSLRDFIDIIHGQFISDITTSSTVDPNTTDKEETSPAADKSTTQGIGSTSGSTSNRVSTESATTDSITASSTTAEISTERSTTVESTTAAKTTVTSQATERSSTASTNVPTVTSNTAFTNAPTASDRQTVFTRGSSTPFTLNTPFFPETSSPEPTHVSLAGPGGSNNAGIAVGAFFGVGIIIAIGIGAYKLFQRCRRYAEPGYSYYKSTEPNRASLENLVRNASGNQLNYIEGASNSSDSRQSTTNSIYEPINSDNISVNPPASSSSLSTSSSEIPLDGMSVGSSSASETKLDVDNQSSSPSDVNTPPSRSSSLSLHFSNVSLSASSNDQPRSLLQRIMFCCGRGNGSLEGTELNGFVSGNDGRSSPSRT